ncbi:MAG: protein-L-isoaspartate(D-aspartate) O-methyltransferase [Spirochaetia bacterium]
MSVAVEIHEYLAEDGITSSRVLDAFRAVPRDRFVPESSRSEATSNHPLPIGHGQTISQPYIVAYMTEALDLRSGDRVLEIGTGSGYQAAILAELTREVFSVEVVPTLAARARMVLDELGYDYVQTKTGNGYHGWSEHAPYPAIIVTAAATQVPPALVEQLAPSGRMIIPVGASFAVQQLVLVRRTASGKVREELLLPVRFVPFTGEREG